jgi:hypothetical protein
MAGRLALVGHVILCLSADSPKNLRKKLKFFPHRTIPRPLTVAVEQQSCGGGSSRP